MLINVYYSTVELILKKLLRHELNNVLFAATGALMSPDSIKQGMSIPGIAHLIHIKNERI